MKTQFTAFQLKAVTVDYARNALDAFAPAHIDPCRTDCTQENEADGSHHVAEAVAPQTPVSEEPAALKLTRHSHAVRLKWL